jgi:two-component system, OmpR family, response regulator
MLPSNAARPHAHEQSRRHCKLVSDRTQCASCTLTIQCRSLKCRLRAMTSSSEHPMDGELEIDMRSGPPGAEVMHVEVRRLLLPCSEPLPVGSVLTLNLKLAEGVEVKTMARVSEVTPGNPSSQKPFVMRVQTLGVWGDRATEQLSTYLREAITSAPPRREWITSLGVLVVDDNDQYRTVAAEALRDAGFEVITASNGFEALSLALKHQPSAIVTDVTMPGMDGWQLLRMVRSRPTLRRTPVIFLTDLSSESERLRGYQLGVDDYVNKPFSSVELLARVERVLERARMADDASANGMHGDLSRVSLASLLSLAEMERRTGVLQLLRDGERATLHIREGAVVRIDLTDPHDMLEGVERFFHVLDWDSGRFELVSIDVLAEDELGLRTTYALLEHARRHDEGAQP